MKRIRGRTWVQLRRNEVDAAVAEALAARAAACVGAQAHDQDADTIDEGAPPAPKTAPPTFGTGRAGPDAPTKRIRPDKRALAWFSP